MNRAEAFKALLELVREPVVGLDLRRKDRVAAERGLFQDEEDGRTRGLLFVGLEGLSASVFEHSMNVIRTTSECQPV